MILDSRLARRVRTQPNLRPVGIAAYRAFARVRPTSPGPRVLANSIPKAGTHLLMSLLEAMKGMHFSGRHVAYGLDSLEDERRRRTLNKLGRELGRVRPSQYMAGHLRHEPEVVEHVRTSGCRHLLAVRDPRDIVLSHSAYIVDNPRHPLHDRFLSDYPDERQRLEAVITGFPAAHGVRGLVPLSETLGWFSGWTDEDSVCVVRFEDLVGLRGGGDDATQFRTVTRILTHLGIPSDDDTVAALCSRAYSPTAATFRRGRINTWRDELSPEHLDLVQETCADSMTRLGYPV